MKNLPDYVKNLAAPDVIEFAVVMKYTVRPLPNTFEEFLEILEAIKGEIFDDSFCYADELEEIRSRGIPTGLPTHNRHPRYFEVKSVAAELLPGVWVGWDYYYGGGECLDGSGIEWVPSAYFVEVKQETKIVNTFTKKEID